MGHRQALGHPSSCRLPGLKGIPSVPPAHEPAPTSPGEWGTSPGRGRGLPAHKSCYSSRLTSNQTFNLVHEHRVWSCGVSLCVCDGAFLFKDVTSFTNYINSTHVPPQNIYNTCGHSFLLEIQL